MAFWQLPAKQIQHALRISTGHSTCGAQELGQQIHLKTSTSSARLFFRKVLLALPSEVQLEARGKEKQVAADLKVTKTCLGIFTC